MKAEKRFRELKIERAAIDEESRTVSLSFSSEEPYARSWGVEVLDHGEGSVDLSRLERSAPLLLNHDPSLQVGVVENARIDEDRIGRATVRFSKSQLGEEIFGDVSDGIRRLVSVGYQVNQVEKAERDEDGLDTVFRVSSWTPLEVSLVATPADISVGVGRSDDSEDSEPLVEVKTSTEDTNMEETNSVTVDASPRIEIDESRIRKAEQKRSKEIVQLGAKYDCIDAAQKAIEDGKDAGQFSRWILENNSHLKTNEPSEVRQDDGEIGLSEQEVQSYSLTRAINGFCNSGRFEGLEAEASEAAKKRYGRNVDGLVVPTDVLTRDLNVTTAVDGGNAVATDLLSGSFIDLLRNASVISQTGATYLNNLQGDVAIPRQSASATASWETEVAAVSETSAQIDQVTLSAKGLTAMTSYSKQLLAQSSVSVEQFVRQDLASILAVAQDLAAVDGLGSSNEPLGIMRVPGIGTITANTNNYINAVNLESAVAVDNALTGSLAYVTNAKLIGKFKQSEVASSTGRFVYEDGKVNGYPCYMSNQMPATYSTNTKSAIVFGNFSDLIVGNWSGLDVVVDPYSVANKRQVRLVTSLWTDMAVRHPESFAYAKDIVH